MIQSHLENWERYYQPASRLNWRGRVDSDRPTRFHEVTTCLDLRNDGFKEGVGQHTYALVGFACDEGVRRNLGRPGAARGPDACRTSLANAPIGEIEDLQLYDLGNVACWDGDLEAAQQALADVVEAVLRHGAKPIVVGGGHETAWGHYQGINKAQPGLDLGIVNFDAHFDMRPLIDNKGTSGTSFLQMAVDRQQRGLPFDYTCIGTQSTSNTKVLFDEADRLGVQWVTAEELFKPNSTEAELKLKEVIERRRHLYCTVCLDVFASSVAPGVSAPQPFGIHPWHILPLVRQLAKSNKVRSFDICELSPPFDHDGATAQLAAALISVYIHG